MSDKEKLVQISELRKEKEENLKREYERVLFEKILGCYTVIEKLGLKQINVKDISKSGLSFSIDGTQGLYKVGEEIDMRFYFSHKTYLPIKMTIRRIDDDPENANNWIYGCSFDTTVTTYNALEKFVEFIQAYSQAAKKDQGDKTILYF